MGPIAQAVRREVAAEHADWQAFGRRLSWHAFIDGEMWMPAVRNSMSEVVDSEHMIDWASRPMSDRTGAVS